MHPVSICVIVVVIVIFIGISLWLLTRNMNDVKRIKGGQDEEARTLADALSDISQGNGNKNDHDIVNAFFNAMEDVNDNTASSRCSRLIDGILSQTGPTVIYYWLPGVCKAMAMNPKIEHLFDRLTCDPVKELYITFIKDNQKHDPNIRYLLLKSYIYNELYPKTYSRRYDDCDVEPGINDNNIIHIDITDVIEADVIDNSEAIIKVYDSITASDDKWKMMSILMSRLTDYAGKYGYIYAKLVCDILDHTEYDAELHGSLLSKILNDFSTKSPPFKWKTIHYWCMYMHLYDDEKATAYNRISAIALDADMLLEISDPSNDIAETIDFDLIAETLNFSKDAIMQVLGKQVELINNSAMTKDLNGLNKYISIAHNLISVNTLIN